MLRQPRGFNLIELLAVIAILGMLSVYLAGNARGYDPSMPVLIRNALLMCVFFLVYRLLKKRYLGDYSRNR